MAKWLVICAILWCSQWEAFHYHGKSQDDIEGIAQDEQQIFNPEFQIQERVAQKLGEEGRINFTLTLFTIHF